MQIIAYENICLQYGTGRSGIFSVQGVLWISLLLFAYGVFLSLAERLTFQVCASWDNIQKAFPLFSQTECSFLHLRSKCCGIAHEANLKK